MKRRRNQSGGRTAFTQIELLVVLACLAILATILVPAMHASQLQRGRLQALTALRTMGTGIDLYVDDHDGYLPGPLWAGQIPSYSTEGIYLGFYLWPYVGASSPTSQSQQIPAFADPYREHLGFITHYVRNYRVTVEGEFDPIDPFGYPGASGRDEPMPYYVVESPSSVWAVRDVSKEDVSGRPVWWSLLPEKAIYGAPHALFFDGHVERLPVGRPPSY